MEEIILNTKRNIKQATSNNEGVAVIEIILILVDIFIFNYICVSSI